MDAIALCFPLLFPLLAQESFLITQWRQARFTSMRWSLVALVRWIEVARFGRMHAVLRCKVDETSPCQEEITGNQIRNKHFFNKVYVQKLFAHELLTQIDLFTKRSGNFTFWTQASGAPQCLGPSRTLQRPLPRTHPGPATDQWTYQLGLAQLGS